MGKRNIFETKENLEKVYIEVGNAKEVAKIYNVNVKTVYSLLKHYDIKSIGSQGARKHKFNEGYFSIIDTKEKAYWLGFIMADGCVYNGSDEHSLRLQMNLKGSDVGHLEKFQLAIGSSYKINVKDYNNSKVAILKVNSTKMCNDLINLGVIQRKSIVCEMPPLRVGLYRHFIRGYFDGDGYITKTDRVTRLSWACGFVGGETMLTQLKHRIPVEMNIYKKKGQKVVYLETSSHKNIGLFLDWLYDDTKIYLDRKYERFNEFKNLVP